MIKDIFNKWLKSLLGLNKELDELRKFPILKDFSYHELSLFQNIIQERSFKEGEYLYREQYPLAVIYLIKKGAIEVKDNYHCTDTPVVLTKHQFLGIVDMYNKNRRQGEAKAIKDSTLLAISYIDYENFITHNPRTGVKLLNNICKVLSHFIYQKHNLPVE
jgi:signal-transduction protein with cAMP-binding, CBS, and nucleotidyltransferase domain